MAVTGGIDSPTTLDRCLDGIDAVFLVWQAPAVGVAPALERIAKQALRIVFLSNLTVRDDMEQQAYAVTTLHASIERLIEGSGVRWTFLRPGAFAANALLWWLPQVRAGDIVRWPYPGAVTSPIHERDIAAVAVRALCEDDPLPAGLLISTPNGLAGSCGGGTITAVAAATACCQIEMISAIDEGASYFRRVGSVQLFCMSVCKTRSSTARIMTSSAAVRDFSAGFKSILLSG